MGSYDDLSATDLAAMLNLYRNHALTQAAREVSTQPNQEPSEA